MEPKETLLVESNCPQYELIQVPYFAMHVSSSSTLTTTRSNTFYITCLCVNVVEEIQLKPMCKSLRFLQASALRFLKNGVCREIRVPRL